MLPSYYYYYVYSVFIVLVTYLFTCVLPCVLPPTASHNTRNLFVNFKLTYFVWSPTFTVHDF